MHEEEIIIPRMGTIKEAAQTFRLSEHYIRNLVRSGETVATKTGNKYLVNLGKLAEYLNTHRLTPDDDGCAGAHDVNPIVI